MTANRAINRKMVHAGRTTDTAQHVLKLSQIGSYQAE